MEAEQPIEATITGSKGSVVVHDRAHNPTSMTFLPKGEFLLLRSIHLEMHSLTAQYM